MTSDENIQNSSIFEVGADTCPEACRFVFRYPCTECILSSFHIDAKYKKDTFADDTIILAGIEYNAVKEHYRIYLFKRTVLPLIYVCSILSVRVCLFSITLGSNSPLRSWNCYLTLTFKHLLNCTGKQSQ